MATGSADSSILKHFKSVSSQSSSSGSLPDPIGPLSMKVPLKVFEMANAEVEATLNEIYATLCS